MTHLIPSKARKQRNSSAEVRDYRPLARGPQAQNPGNHPILFYKISHTKHFALIPCRLPDCAPTHCSPSSPALGKRDRTKQPAASTPAPLQTAAGTADRPEQKFFQGWMGGPGGRRGQFLQKTSPPSPGKPDLPPPSDKYRVSSSRHPCPATSLRRDEKRAGCPALVRPPVPPAVRRRKGPHNKKKRFTAPQGSGPARPVR